MFPPNRSLYSVDERQKLLDYIVDHNLYFELRGRTVWEEIEKRQICPGRTWQSMKEHFQKQIINNLDSLKINTPEKVRLRSCYHGTYRSRSFKRNRNIEDENWNVSKKNKLATSNSANTIEELDKSISSQQHSNNQPTNVENTQRHKSGTRPSSESEPYSEQEDRKIVEYLKNNVNWGDLRGFDDLYEMCHRQILHERDATSIKNRFVNVILPDLHRRNLVNVDDLLFFYDRVDCDIPPDLDAFLSVPTNTCNTRDPNFQLSQETKTNNENNIPAKTDAAVQVNDFYFFAQTKGGQLCMTVKNVDHIFISENDADKNSIITELANYKILKENIHIVNDKLHNDLKRLKKVSNLLEKKILKFINKEPSVNLEKLELLNSKCSCDWDQSSTAQYPSIHLPLNIKTEFLNESNSCTSNNDVQIISDEEEKNCISNDEDIDSALHSSPIIASLESRCKIKYINKKKLMSNGAAPTPENNGEQTEVTSDEQKEIKFQFLTSRLFVDEEIDDDVIVIDD